MGLLDSITGQVVGALSNAGGGGQHSLLIDAIGGLLTSQPGGLSGLVAAFEQQGLGGVIGSWIGTGQNHSITPEQLQAVLGSEQIQAIAQRLGFSPQEVSGHLAQLLPQVVDQLTPGGSVPEGGEFGGLLGSLKGLQG